jgi:hypothetical protein
MGHFHCPIKPQAGLSPGVTNKQTWGGAAAATERAATDKTLNPVSCACPQVSRALISARSLRLTDVAFITSQKMV